ncbi:hypothetical protein IFR04_002078 [Cadophora malorum]|uniref:BTB domain-containing protein n=1 Tax=Cadophora malorum TaxID=108018 RepID=A0A8H8BUN0_9HELO|nr:hypothetical protein IFR04_002078 [Cadophora malorum]
MPTIITKLLGESLGTELVTIHVGKKRKEFGIYQNLICQVDYFQKAFNGSFVESNGTMYLSDETSGSFSLFVHCLYKGAIPDGNNIDHFENLINLHIFSEKICYGELGNWAMDSLRAITFDHPHIKITAVFTIHVYSNTGSISCLRKWCVQMLAFDLWHESQGNFIPVEKDLEDLAVHFRDHADLHDEGQTCRHVGIAQGSGTAWEGDANLSDTSKFSD